MACVLERGLSGSPILLHDQNVIRVVGRDREDGYAIRRDRFDEGEQHSGLRKGKWAFEFQANPAGAGIDTVRNVLCRTNDGKFFRAARDRRKVAVSRPLGNGCIWRHTNNRVRAGKQAEF